MQRYYYSETLLKFLSQSDELILGRMDAQNEFDLTIDQRGAWVVEIPIMKNVVRALPGDGQILFEYTIPRLGKRVDVVLLYKGIVFAIEFKVGADEFLANDKEQVWDYALDLKNFHEESRDRIIVPILVATEAPDAFLGCTNYKADKTGCDGFMTREYYENYVVQNVDAGK